MNHIVGGHTTSFPTMTLEGSSGSSLIKSSTIQERQFYETVGPELSEDLIGIWTAAFYGTLKLEGRLNEEQEIQFIQSNEVKPEMLVLENLTYRFLRPNVLDIKLGTQLYDDDATEEKKARMKKSSEETTSAVTGMRFTGFQVWDSISQTYIKTDKSYGKSLKPDQLAEALDKFLLTAAPNATTPTNTTRSPKPIAIDLMKDMVEGLLQSLIDLSEVVASLEFRMRGGSLLILYEGDESTLRSSLEREADEPDGAEWFTQSTLRRMRADVERLNGEISEEEHEMIEEDDYDSDSSASTSDENGNPLINTLRSFDLRLIDFAHTTATPGQGPDQGILMGLRSMQLLLERWLSLRDG